MISLEGTKIRIAHVITRLINGGADENTVITCNQAVAEDNEVFLLHGVDTHTEIIEKVDNSVILIKVSSLNRSINPWLDLKAYRELKALFKELRPEVVHTHTSKAGFLGRMAAAAADVPLIVHGVHIAPFENVGLLSRLLYLYAEKIAAKNTHAFIDVSEGMEKIYLQAGLGEPESHYIVPSGFDVGRFNEASPPDDWRKLLGLEKEAASKPPVLLMIAAFEARKRHLELLRELPQLISSYPDIRILLVGDGKLRNEIEAEVVRLQLTKNVILTGFRDDPECLIALADICMIASIREGLPRVVMQYLAGGKPCIASELPGLEQVLQHGVNGMVVPSENLKVMIEIIIGLLGNHEELQVLESGAQNSDLSNWDASIMGEKVLDVYAKYLESLNKNNYRV